MMLLRIVAPHFVAGVELGHRAAPIIGYMRTWTLRRIQSYCAMKGWRVQTKAIPDHEVEPEQCASSAAATIPSENGQNCAPRALKMIDIGAKGPPVLS